jgi:phage gp36-like protein
MAYSDQDDILEQLDEDILVQLTDDADAGAVDTDKVTRAIADADALIDGYCGRRYTVPFTTVPALILKFSVDIAIYNLYGRRKGAPDDRRTRYNDAVSFLKAVAKNEAALGEDDPLSAESEAPQMSSLNPDRVFTRSSMTGF